MRYFVVYTVFCMAWQPAFFGGVLLLLLFGSVYFIFEYIELVFKIPCSSYSLVVDTINTNLNEVLAFLNIGNISLISAFWLTLVLLGLYIRYFRPAKPSRKVIFTVTAFLLILIPLILPITMVKCLSQRLAAIAENVEKYVKYDFQVLKQLKKVEQAEVTAEYFSKDYIPPVVFLHVGESVRADHASFNGYKRETMPNVHQEFRRGNVVSFPRCISFATATRMSMLGIMTPATLQNPTMEQGSFVPYLNKGGLNTFSLFSGIRLGGFWSDSSLHVVTSQIKNKLHNPKTSDFLHDDAANIIKSADNNTFIFYYGEGAHAPAVSYNKAKYLKFTPVSDGHAEDIRRINNYDNCIVATDDFIGNAIDNLRDKNAVYIYVGDHGEMLGEDNFWNRNEKCLQRPETRHVLFFIWCSDKFKEQNPELWTNLKNNRLRLNRVSHDFIYHSVLRVCGIKSPFYNSDFDIFSEKAKEFPNIMPTNSGLRFENKLVEWKGM